jgi:hypothetical protein
LPSRVSRLTRPPISSIFTPGSRPECFEREDWTLFQSLGTLGQKAGVPLEKLPALIVKELVDNALDAGAGVMVGNGFFVKDNGPGIGGGDDEVAALFSISRPLTSSKMLRLPTRGALGNGLRVVAGAVLASGGDLVVETSGRRLQLIPREDGGTTAVPLGAAKEGGTKVEVHLGPRLVVDHRAMEWARGASLLARGVGSYSGKTSPHWYDSDSFYELMKAAVGQSVADVVGLFDGCAHPKAGKIAREFAGRKATDLDRAETDRLLDRARQVARPVNPPRLGCVGPDVDKLPTAYAKEIGQFHSGTRRGPLEASLPYVLEAWAEIAKVPSISVSVNRTPITADVQIYHDRKDGDLSIFGCGLEDRFNIGRRPVRMHLNIDTPYMPITSDGKAPDLVPLLGPIGDTIRKAAKRAKSMSPTRTAGVVASQKDIILGHLDEAVAKASEGGKYRFSLRRLFYAVRPHVIEACGKEPEYGYFGQVITDYEAGQGCDLPGIYRDSRGTLYHPHTGQDIPLGTINVEGYERPAWTFNKILYCEKEGFFPILKDAGWPERHDCALMTSKGFASRAARDVLDLLGESGEDLIFYCIHDADAYGTTIYQALQEGTQARPGRKVRIVNLGLEPDEAIEMGLQVEAVNRKGEKGAPVAGYATPEWAECLRGKCVELNAMTTPQFLAWLDRKFEGRDDKVIPPVEVTVGHLVRGVHDHLNRVISAEVLRKAGLPGLVEAAYEKRRSLIDARSATLCENVRRPGRRAGEPLDGPGGGHRRRDRRGCMRWSPGVAHGRQMGKARRVGPRAFDDRAFLACGIA